MSLSLGHHHGAAGVAPAHHPHAGLLPAAVGLGPGPLPVDSYTSSYGTNPATAATAGMPAPAMLYAPNFGLGAKPEGGWRGAQHVCVWQPHRQGLSVYT